jgi:phenylpropionate dioxygenase-like ring-hydroxylating dioxygenase large terminal subunit
LTTRGEARSAGPSYQAVLAGDRMKGPPSMRVERFEWPGDTTIDPARYTSREFAALEAERLWPNVWQMACRLEHLPEVGSYVTYEVADVGLIVVRTGPEEIKAFHNSCLHRGTTLAEGDGRISQLRCPFHAWTWDLDGTLRSRPAGWDFPEWPVETLRLPEAAVATWGGFVFVHPSQTPSLVTEPFEQFSAPLAEHFADHPLDDRYLHAHAGRVIRANWKATLEAFLETYHVPATHPQTARFANDLDAQYDTLGPNLTRVLEAIGVPISVLVGKVTDAQVADRAQHALPREFWRDVPEDVRARTFLAERHREALSAMWGVDLSAASEAELLDTDQYHLFPNFFPWLGYYLPIAYRFRPWGDDPDESLMEIMVLHPRPADGREVRPAEMQLLGPDESWTNARGLELLGIVFDQDTANLARVQRGMRFRGGAELALADYQEIRIRHYHHRLDQVLGLA